MPRERKLSPSDFSMLQNSMSRSYSKAPEKKDSPHTQSNRNQMKKSPSDKTALLPQVKMLEGRVQEKERDENKKERNHTENRASRRRADTTPTKGSSNDEDPAFKTTEIVLFLNQSDVKKSPLLKEKNGMFQS